MCRWEHTIDKEHLKFKEWIFSIAYFTIFKKGALRYAGALQSAWALGPGLCGPLSFTSPLLPWALVLHCICFWLFGLK